MKRGFDNFNAVDSGFVSFVTPTIPGETLNQQTINTNNLLSNLPQRYLDALHLPNLLKYLNATQSEALRNDIIAIANNSSTSMPYKIIAAQGKIEQALPNNPNIANFRVVASLQTSQTSQTSQSLNNLIAQLPQQYQDTLNVDNLSSKLNSIQLKELYDSLEYIASRDMSLEMKIRLAKSKINSYDAIRLPMDSIPLPMQKELDVQMFVRELEMLGDIDQSTITKLGNYSFEQQIQLQEQLAQVVYNTQLTSEEKRSIGKEIIINFLDPQNSQTKSTQSQNQNQSNDSIKNVFIVLAIVIVGFMGYTALKK